MLKEREERVCLCMPGYVTVCADRGRERWWKMDNSDSVVIWKMTGYLYNLAMTWQSPSLRVNLVKTCQDADSYLCCLAATACPRVWRTGWRAEGCGETACDHNWGCCLNSLFHNLKRENKKRSNGKLKQSYLPAQVIRLDLTNDCNILNLALQYLVSYFNPLGSSS